MLRNNKEDKLCDAFMTLDLSLLWLFVTEVAACLKVRLYWVVKKGTQSSEYPLGKAWRRFQKDLNFWQMFRLKEEVKKKNIYIKKQIFVLKINLLWLAQL